MQRCCLLSLRCFKQPNLIHNLLLATLTLYCSTNAVFKTCIASLSYIFLALHWRHNGPDDVSNHQPQDCLLNRLFRRRSKKTSKLRVTGLCAGNSPETGEFPAQMASNAENVSIWWRHHGQTIKYVSLFHHAIFCTKSPGDHMQRRCIDAVITMIWYVMKYTSEAVNRAPSQYKDRLI